MRTTDFSGAPKQARAEAMVIAEFSRASVTGARQQSRSAPDAQGYVWHKTFGRDGTPGLLVFFDSREAAAAYRSRLNPGSVRTRLLVAEPNGYSNGVWRAEANVMGHIPTFTPTSVEVARGASGPTVASGPAASGPATASGQTTASGPTGSHGSLGGTGGTAPRAGHGAGRVTARLVTDAGAMFIGATKYRGPWALVQLSRTWYPMIARMERLRGYVWHTIYWEPPFTLGTVAFFATRDDLLSFARLPAHRALMQWITRGTCNGTGGYIRLHTAPAEEPPADAIAPVGREAA